MPVMGQKGKKVEAHCLPSIKKKLILQEGSGTNHSL